jgi:acyl-homoserine lactone acylase PvdQ
MYADADGTIAYWHPGLYPVRSPKVDLRFPTPGTGGYEWEGFFSFEQMPHARNPAQGYLANWNTKPSVGWLEEAGAAPGQPKASLYVNTGDPGNVYNGAVISDWPQSGGPTSRTRRRGTKPWGVS